MKNADSLWLSLIRSANRRTRNSQVLRRAGILAYRSFMQTIIFLPPPKVLLIGPPKSGTHLLSDCLSLMPRMMFSGRHFALTDFYDRSGECGNVSGSEAYPALRETDLRNFLKRTPRGMFATAHARFHPSLVRFLEELGFKQVLLLRDPRDVVVSHVFYVKRERLHQHHTYFMEVLKSNEECIMATIKGFESSAGYTSISIKERFDGYIAYFNHSSTLVVRFEDLVGPQGGGDAEKQLTDIQRIGEFVNKPIDRGQARQIAEKIYGKSTLTFRKGQSGDWRNHFTDAHRRAFKEIAGETLIRLGYEKDTDW